MDRFYSIGDIARLAGEPLHRIRHVIESRNVKPVGRLAGTRVWDESAAQFIERELRRIDAQRGRLGDARMGGPR